MNIRSTWSNLSQDQKERVIQSVVGDIMVAVAIVGFFGFWGIIFVLGMLMVDYGNRS